MNAKDPNIPEEESPISILFKTHSEELSQVKTVQEFHDIVYNLLAENNMLDNRMKKWTHSLLEKKTPFDCLYSLWNKILAGEPNKNYSTSLRR